MWQDLKFGLKLLWKQKAFSLAALLTLALCIGANTAIFTVLNAVVIRDLPFPNPGRLVTLYNTYPGVGVERGANAAPDYLDRRKMTEVFAAVAESGNNGFDVGQEGSPQRIAGSEVTPSYFAVLGVEPILGRAFTEEEGTLGNDNVAILSEGLWKQMFSSDPDIIGKDIRLSGMVHRIVGVMPEKLGVLRRDVRVWVPLAFTQEQRSDESRHSNNWSMIARLQPGVTLQQAQQRIDALNHANRERFPKYRDLLDNARFGTIVVGLRDEMAHDARPILYLLQAAVAGVLLIGCVNLANLMLVRSNVRLREMAVRFSLGASRLRLGRQLMTESVTLAALGGALGVAVGYGGVQLLSFLGAGDLPRAVNIAIDARVLAFTAVIALLTGLLFGSVPLFHLFKRDLYEVFRENDRSGTSGQGALWIRSSLVVCQVALAFVLLIGSGLLTLSFSRLLTVDPGFRSGNVTTAGISLPDVRYHEKAARRDFLTKLLERLRAIPGVKHAGSTSFLPFSGNNNSSVITVENRPLAPGEAPPVPAWNNVDGGYFQAMGIQLIEGRTFNDSDSADAQKVAIIDEYLARKYWPQGGAIGAGIRRGLPDLPMDNDLCTIIGVVRSVKTGDLADQHAVGQVYFHYKQYPERAFYVVLKTDRDSPQLAETIRRELVQADPELPLFDTKTMPERLSASLVSRRAAMVLCLIFGGLALLLAAIGIYGVLAYSVTQRTREFGIRVALGAELRDVLGIVISQGLKLAGIGLLIGAVVAFALTRLMAAMLYEVKPTDPTVFLAVAVVLGGVALTASLIPSLRAARIQPATALRTE